MNQDKQADMGVSASAATNDAPVLVEQCDRDMAWEFRPGGYGWADRIRWDSGTYDGNRIIQAFARHRLAALRSRPASDGEVERVWSALKDRCCSDPKEAKRCVMVSRADLVAALQDKEEPA